MRILATIFICGIISVQSAHAQNDYSGSQEKLRLSVVDEIYLHENLSLLSEIVDVAISRNNDAIFVVSEGVASVVEYDMEGNQVRIFGRWGKGPSEYDIPQLVQQSEKGDVVVWDAGSLKYIIYRSDGVYVSELTGQTASVSGFGLLGTSVLSTKGGGHLENVVQYFNQQGELQAEWGHYPFDHVVLDLLSGGGPYVAIGPEKDIYVADASSPDIHSVTSDGDTLATWKYTSDLFEFENGYYVDRESVQTALLDGSIIPYLASSSRLRSIYAPCKDLQFLVLEHGQSRGKDENHSRPQELVAIANSGSEYDSIFFRSDGEESPGRIVAISSDQVYFILEQFVDGEVLRKLTIYKWGFHD